MIRRVSENGMLWIGFMIWEQCQGLNELEVFRFHDGSTLSEFLVDSNLIV